MSTQDWRPYQMLTRDDWRHGDEPEIRAGIHVEYEGKEVTIPLPKGAVIRIIPHEKPREKPDPNEDKYTCQPYGVAKCPNCLKPHDYCFCER